MDVDQVGHLLKAMAAYDARTVGPLDIAAWGHQLEDIDYQDAIEAVHAHYAASRERIMPADVRQRATKIRNARNKRPDVPLPGCYEPDEAERRRLATEDGEPHALPAGDVVREVRVIGGLAECRDVLGAIVSRLVATEDGGEPSESDKIRQRALEVARASRRGQKS